MRVVSVVLVRECVPGDDLHGVVCVRLRERVCVRVRERVCVTLSLPQTNVVHRYDMIWL